MLPQVWGFNSGGFVKELRLKFNAATNDTKATFVTLQTYGGGLDFENTKVGTWMQRYDVLGCTLRKLGISSITRDSNVR